MRPMNKVYVESKAQLDELCECSALTVVGLEESSIPAFVRWVEQNDGGKIKEAFVIKGETMNRHYGLAGKNAYKSDLTIVCVKAVHSGKVVIGRFQFDGHWFDDVVNGLKI